MEWFQVVSLQMLHENVTNGFNSLSLNFIAIAAILSGILVIVSKNPIVSVLFLIGLFLTLSIYLMLLGINFIGLSYLLVYVGAISILFLFILMLINIRISEIFNTTSNSIPLAIVIGSLFFSTVNPALPLAIFHDNNNNISLNSAAASLKFEISRFFNKFIPLSNGGNEEGLAGLASKTTNLKHQDLGFVSSQTWDTMLADTSHINTLGNILYVNFPLWLLITSLVLLLSMVGAILITIN